MPSSGIDLLPAEKLLSPDKAEAIPKAQSVCFTGHRAIAAEEIPRLERELDRTVAMLIGEGCTRFMCGGALGFDTLAAQAVLRAAEHNTIRFELAVPCADQARRWTEKQQREYRSIANRADGIYCLFPHYVDGCMQVRNRFMVSCCGTLIAYCMHLSGGAGYTVRFALDSGCRVLNV